MVLPLVAHWLLVRADQDTSVPLVVRNLPVLPVWVGSRAVRAAAAVVAPVPPLAMARVADRPAAVVAVLALPVRAPTKPVVAVKVGAVTVPVKVGEARGARLGTSAATRDRKLGAPVDPLGLAKTRFAAAVAAPVPPLATGSVPVTPVASATWPQEGAAPTPPEIRALPVATSARPARVPVPLA